MRTPGFWSARRATLAANLLRPAAFLYGAVAAHRLKRPGMRADAPVVCVGNFTVGGAGKTPTAIALAHVLREMGQTPAFLTRGYGGTLPGPVVVDRTTHSFRDVGDEPLLLARVAPTIVARHRPAGARLCVAQGANVILMDDGLQNPSLRKDLSLAVLDGEAGLGNGLCLPAGPLRAPMAAQWPLVDAVVVLGEPCGAGAAAEEAAARGIPLLAATLQPDAQARAHLRGRRVLAFAGIGRPQKFFASLESCGAEIVERRAFSDHHPYAVPEIERMVEEARANGLTPVTTEKDAVRIAALGRPDLADGIKTLPVTLAFAEPARVRALLGECLARRRADGRAAVHLS